MIQADGYENIDKQTKKKDRVFWISIGASVMVVALIGILVLALRSRNHDVTNRKVLILALDGAKASVLHQAMFNLSNAPNLKYLLANGVGSVCSDIKSPECVFTHSGNRYGSKPPITKDSYKSIYEWVTGPGWCSVLTGVDTPKHQVRGNEIVELLPFVKSSKDYPTIFMRAKAAGLRTAASGDYGFLSSSTLR